LTSKPKILSTKIINPKLDENRFELYQHNFIKTKSLNFECDNNYDINIFSSQNAIESILKSKHLEKIKSKPCLCVGQKTHQLLQKHSFNVFEVANCAENLITIISQKYMNQSFSFFCGNLSLPTIPNHFIKKHIIFAKVLVYETQKTPLAYPITFDALLFFSPSGVESFLEQNQINHQKCFCIGHTTAKALTKHHKNNIIIAENSTIESVLNSLNNYYK